MNASNSINGTAYRLSRIRAYFSWQANIRLRYWDNGYIFLHNFLWIGSMSWGLWSKIPSIECYWLCLHIVLSIFSHWVVENCLRNAQYFSCIKYFGSLKTLLLTFFFGLWKIYLSLYEIRLGLKFIFYLLMHSGTLVYSFWFGWTHYNRALTVGGSDAIMNKGLKQWRSMWFHH